MQQVVNIAGDAKSSDSAQTLQQAEKAVEDRPDDEAAIESLRELLGKLRAGYHDAIQERLRDTKLFSAGVLAAQAGNDSFSSIYTAIWAGLINREGVHEHDDTEGIFEYRHAIQSFKKSKQSAVHKEALRQKMKDPRDPLELHIMSARAAPIYNALVDAVVEQVKAQEEEEKKDDYDPALAIKLEPVPTDSNVLKRSKRIIEKAALSYDNPDCVDRVFDTVRRMVTVSKMSQVAAVFNSFRGEMKPMCADVETTKACKGVKLKIVRVKERFFEQPSPGGWRDLMLNLELNATKDGIKIDLVCELQIVHSLMYHARKGLPGHVIYSRVRNATELLEKQMGPSAADSMHLAALNLSLSDKQAAIRKMEGIPHLPKNAREVPIDETVLKVGFDEDDHIISIAFAAGKQIPRESEQLLLSAMKAGAWPKLKALPLVGRSLLKARCEEFALLQQRGNLSFLPSEMSTSDRLDFHAKPLSEGDMPLIAASFRAGSLPHIERIDLERTNLDDDGLCALASVLGEDTAPKLTVLLLGQNNFQQPGLQGLLAVLSKLKRLKQLRLDKFTMPVAQIRADASGKGPAKLDFSGKLVGCFDMQAFEKLAAVKGALSKLTELVLFNNKIGNDGLQALQALIVDGALGALRSVNLLWNEFDSESARKFADAVHSRKHLDFCGLNKTDADKSTRISFRGWNLKDSDAVLVASSLRSFGGLTQLTTLELDHNLIADRGLDCLSELLANPQIKMPKLHTIDLLGNKFSLAAARRLVRAVAPRRGLNLCGDGFYTDGQIDFKGYGVSGADMVLISHELRHALGRLKAPPESLVRIEERKNITAVELRMEGAKLIAQFTVPQGAPKRPLKRKSHQSIRLLVCPQNEGAVKVAEEFKAADLHLNGSATCDVILGVSDDKPPEDSFALVYLNKNTVRDEQTTGHLRWAMKHKVPTVIVAEQDPEHGGCPFGDLISASPTGLLDAHINIYNDKNTLLLPCHASTRALSIRLAQQALTQAMTLRGERAKEEHGDGPPSEKRLNDGNFRLGGGLLELLACAFVCDTTDIPLHA